MKTPSSSSAAAITLIRGGMKHLQRFFQSEREKFMSSPILLLVQHFPADRDANSITTSLRERIQMNAIQQVQYVLQQKLGYQTFVATCGNATSPNSNSNTAMYYPTIIDIKNAMNLSHTIGAYNIVAVGTGNVMDVGKAMYQTNDLLDELVLIPTTYMASMVSTSSHALIYDPQEDTLLPKPSLTSESLSHSSSPVSNFLSSSPSSHRPHSMLSIDDLDYDITTTLFDTVTNRHMTLWALLSILLDNIYQDIPIPLRHNIDVPPSQRARYTKYDDHADMTTRFPPPPSSPMSSLTIPNEYLRMIDTIISCMDYNLPPTTSSSSTESPFSQEYHLKMLNLCYEVGNCISYGLPVTRDEEEQIQPRSIPIAMVASLSSKTANISFSQYDAPTIMASFVPSYCDILLEKIQTHNRYTGSESTGNEKRLIRQLETILQKERDGIYRIPKIISTESLMSLISTIQANQMIWNCHAKSYYDGSIDLPTLFRRHLLI
jgi:hypothetical protein